MHFQSHSQRFAGSSFSFGKITRLIIAVVMIVVAGCGGGGGGSSGDASGGSSTPSPTPSIIGTETVLYSFTGSADGSYPMGSLIQASDGNLYGMTWAGGNGSGGTVFTITTAGVQTVLHSFGPATGVLPQGSLIQASDGNFYGMTWGWGASNKGTLFQVTPAGVVTVLHSFAGGAADGANPYGSLIQASDGNFYGMTYGGGANNLGTVFQVTPAGVVTVLHSFAGGSDGGLPYGSLIQASDGNFYGVTWGGGASNKGTLFQITPAGVMTVLHSFAGGATDGANPWGSLIQASDGNFYGMTNLGGASNLGTVFKLTPAGAESVLYSFVGGSNGANPYGDLLQASDGNLYGVTWNGGVSNLGTAFKITPAGVVTVLHSFAGGATDGAQPNGSLIQASDGNLYGMTYMGGAGNFGTVFKIQ